ncbi:uncharacterized protein LOC118203953 isoform X2 [Stegodyphus dumicola]|uniref:uncharacterized protein LOC118203953 isoform X2 n=1 Tax=Stegodyphus dumicola TaxID=202533 RepID=UPI0015AD9E96|nr:uncharacterized protein LOC118203953 isoform X2 [Stegodyphus dumicola]
MMEAVTRCIPYLQCFRRLTDFIRSWWLLLISLFMGILQSLKKNCLKLILCWICLEYNWHNILVKILSEALEKHLTSMQLITQNYSFEGFFMSDIPAVITSSTSLVLASFLLASEKRYLSVKRLHYNFFRNAYVASDFEDHVPDLDEPFNMIQFRNADFDPHHGQVIPNGDVRSL